MDTKDINSATEETTDQQPAGASPEMTTEDLFGGAMDETPLSEQTSLKAMLEAIVYITDEPLTAKQIAAALEQPLNMVEKLLDELVAGYDKSEHGLAVRVVAEGYKMGTKPEHHEAIQAFVKKLQPPLKLSIAALETLAVVAYKQPITAPEIMEIRGVHGTGVLKTLIERKLITTAGRKPVVGRPILYKTTKDFLILFGLKNVKELPTLKEFEELALMALADTEPEEPEASAGEMDREENSTAAMEESPEETNPEEDSTAEPAESTVEINPDGNSIPEPEE